MKKYVKKPVVIEAFRWDGSWECVEKNIPEDDLKYFGIVGNPLTLQISASEGLMKGYFGNYIIRGINGEYYPCSGDVFKDTYDLAE